jgi:hypothetical protein
MRWIAKNSLSWATEPSLYITFDGVCGEVLPCQRYERSPPSEPDTACLLHSAPQLYDGACTANADKLETDLVTPIWHPCRIIGRQFLDELLPSLASNVAIISQHISSGLARGSPAMPLDYDPNGIQHIFTTCLKASLQNAPPFFSRKWFFAARSRFSHVAALRGNYTIASALTQNWHGHPTRYDDKCMLVTSQGVCCEC